MEKPIFHTFIGFIYWQGHSMYVEIGHQLVCVFENPASPLIGPTT